MKEFIFELSQKVRDYECDMQCIVNNSVYQNYFEHARHQFLESTGIPFIELHKQGINPVVSRSDIHYKQSLRSGDTWVCKLYMERVGVKIVFHQKIYRQSDMTLCSFARIETVCTVNGRLTKGEELFSLFASYL